MIGEIRDRDAGDSSVHGETAQGKRQGEALRGGGGVFGWRSRIDERAMLMLAPRRILRKR